MHFFRIAHVRPDWETSDLDPSDNGHPLYVHHRGQGAGRFDQPDHYVGLYLARQAAAAVGEVLGHLATWPASEIERTREIGSDTLNRCLVEVKAEREFIDLDDGAALDRMGWRPSDVVNRDRSKTQELALDQWLRRNEHGKAGFMWWSYWRPSWTVAMAWADPDRPHYPDISVVKVETLHSAHPAILTAASVLKRPIRN